MVVAMPASASGRETRTHIVAPGQLLGTIARKYGISVQALCGANGLNENDIIRPGQRLVIPPPRSANKPGTHIVAPGQTFDIIARPTRPGQWMLHCHIFSHSEGPNGMTGLVTILNVT